MARTAESDHAQCGVGVDDVIRAGFQTELPEEEVRTILNRASAYAADRMGLSPSAERVQLVTVFLTRHLIRLVEAGEYTPEEADLVEALGPGNLDRTVPGQQAEMLDLTKRLGNAHSRLFFEVDNGTNKST